MFLTRGCDFINSAGIRYLLGKMVQATVSGSHGEWQNTMNCSVLICLREALQALCLPKSLLIVEVILLYELPVDITAWTLPSVKCLLSPLKRGAEVLQTLGVFRQVQRIDGPEPMPPPSALIAVTQGLDEGWHCLPLPGCSSIAQGQILVLPKRKLTVRRHTRL